MNSRSPVVRRRSQCTHACRSPATTSPTNNSCRRGESKRSRGPHIHAQPGQARAHSAHHHRGVVATDDSGAHTSKPARQREGTKAPFHWNLTASAARCILLLHHTEPSLTPLCRSSINHQSHSYYPRDPSPPPSPPSQPLLKNKAHHDSTTPQHNIDTRRRAPKLAASKRQQKRTGRSNHHNSMYA